MIAIKAIVAKELLIAITEVANGSTYFTSVAQKSLVDSFTNSRKVKMAKLTGRELEVLRLICREKSSKEIAEELGLAVHTINSFRASLLEKTHCSNSIGLALFASNNGLI